MAKTFTSNLPSVSTGDVLTATAQNNLLTTLNSHTVPPAAMLQLTADTTVTNNQDISWNTTVVYDTDGLFAAGSPTRLTCQTTGIYLVTFGIGLSAATALAGPYAYIGKTGSLNYASAIFGIDGATARMQISTVMSMTASTDYITAGIGWSSATGAVTAFGTTADARRGRLTATFLGKTA